MQPKLNLAQREFIIRALAAFDPPSVVAKAFEAEFGIEIRRQLVERHDPTKAAGATLAPKWRAMFDTARRKFLEDVTEIPIAHRTTRLRALQRMVEAAERKGNYPLTAQLLRQAAEEMGGAYTNRRELTGKDGKDLPAAAPAVAIFALPDNGRDPSA